MATTNYFHATARFEGRLVRLEPFFFDDGDELSVRRAYDAARTRLLEFFGARYSVELLAWRRPRARGAWDVEGLGLVEEAA